VSIAIRMDDCHFDVVHAEESAVLVVNDPKSGVQVQVGFSKRELDAGKPSPAEILKDKLAGTVTVSSVVPPLEGVGA